MCGRPTTQTDEDRAAQDAARKASIEERRKVIRDREEKKEK